MRLRRSLASPAVRLDVRADPDAEPPTAHGLLSLLGAKTFVADESESLIERFAERATVEDHSRHVRERKRRGLDHVAAPQFGGVPSVVGGDVIDQEFAGGVRRRPSDAAVRRYRRFVRQRGDDFALEMIDPVDARHQQRRKVRLDERAGAVE